MPNTHVPFVEDSNTALFQEFLDTVQVGGQKRELFFRPSFGTSAKYNYGRLPAFPQCKQRPEIGTRGNKYPVFTKCPFKYLSVIRSVQLIIADMNGIVTGLSEAFRYQG
jgi:hypothetical protein